MLKKKKFSLKDSEEFKLSNSRNAMKTGFKGGFSGAFDLFGQRTNIKSTALRVSRKHFQELSLANSFGEVGKHLSHSVKTLEHELKAGRDAYARYKSHERNKK